MIDTAIAIPIISAIRAPGFLRTNLIYFFVVLMGASKNVGFFDILGL